MSAIGRRIRARRDELNFTQAELAEKAGLGRSSIAQYERGRTRPRAGELESLARAMDISVDELLTGRKSGSAAYQLTNIEPEQEVLGSIIKHPIFSSKVRKAFHEFLMALEKELNTPSESRSSMGGMRLNEPGNKFNQTAEIAAHQELLKELGKLTLSTEEEGVKSAALFTLKAGPRGTPFKSGQILLLEDNPDIDGATDQDWFLVSLRNKIHFAQKNPKEGIDGFVNSEGLSLSSKCVVVAQIVTAFSTK